MAEFAVPEGFRIPPLERNFNGMVRSDLEKGKIIRRGLNRAIYGLF